MIRLADYIVKRLIEYAEIAFMVTGGGAMHLNDAFGRGKMKVVFCHHEQACSIAAESYSRITNKISVVNVTTGPGGINAINGVFGAWTDSIPMIVVSGQVKRETLVATYGDDTRWRQLGDQEVDIIKMVKGITKYSMLLNDPTMIRYHLEKAIYLALNGRMGPCWIDVPIDLQAMQIDETELIGFNESEFAASEISDITSINDFENLFSLISKSARPVFYIGSGIHSSGTKEIFFQIAQKLGIPIVTAWNSNDLVSDDHPLYVGRPGIIGNRSGNFVVQSSDLLIVLGSRLNIRLVSYNWKSFATRAIKVGVDVDINELNKPTCSFDYKIHQDLKVFLPNFLQFISTQDINFNFSEWIKWGKNRLHKYPVCLNEYWLTTESVNPYCFVDELSKYTKEGENIICADGTACVTTFQAIKIKPNQRVFHNSGCASMGYELPATIGAYFTNTKQDRIICIAGDGSIMLNLQELQTISGLNIPAHIFILNNKGYHSIRQTQNNFFSDNIVGCGVDSGLTFPEFKKVAYAFGFTYFAIDNHTELKDTLHTILETKGKFICEINIDLNQQFSPKVTSRKLADGSMVTSSLEDMWPFLSSEELNQNIIQ